MSFTFKLEHQDGSHADPSELKTAVPNCDTIPLGGRTLRVIDIRDDDADQAPALVVEAA